MTAFKSGDPLSISRLYGRSSGHKLRKRQQELVERLLPQIGVPEDGEITSQRLFGEDRPLHFEIGFGSGHNIPFYPRSVTWVAAIEPALPKPWTATRAIRRSIPRCFAASTTV